ncbi:MAG: two-component sensor histidine kinase [Chitinophagaceae bacterium]|nr:two-component sensor histidine kinase [Chitinophagaceae bacterium]
MFLLQATNTSGYSYVLLLGTLGMLVLTVGLIIFIILHQKRVKRFNEKIQEMEKAQQRLLLNASIKLQEEERQRLAADLHDDAGPLLATARLYLNENLVNQDKATQLQSIFQARQIIDDTIQLVRNISHSLMPPTLKNFGLESAINDLFQKISGSGTINASSRFHEYKERLKEEKELIIFRVVQELINNILKHSNASFIHLTQNVHAGKFYLRIHHDGRGLVQADFDKLNKSNVGLGLKNITSRLRVVDGNINFEKDISQTYYKVTIELPKDEPYE